MVGVQIVITDSSGNAIEGIPVNIKVIPQNFLSGTKTIRYESVVGMVIIS